MVTEVPQSSPQPGMRALAVAPDPSDRENVTTRSVGSTWDASRICSYLLLLG